MSYNIKILNVNAEVLEQLGTKEKFWFTFKGSSVKWLFKYSRDNTGEHWSEKVAEQLCYALGIPHVQYEIAKMNDRWGVVTPSVIHEDSRMVMGNEVLHTDSPSTYPEPTLETQQFVRVKEHTVSRVLGCLDISGILPPISKYHMDNLDAGDVFCGYLMLDALVSNQDRHHENWAIIIDSSAQKKTLCPTYDHAASLGRELLDVERSDRLTTRDTGRRIPAFVKRARSELFKLKTDQKPLFTIDAFYHAVEKRKNAKLFWLTKLNELQDDKIKEIFDNIPNSVISDIAREFALEMVFENKRRLLSYERA
ncbi:MAG: hypothetical protein ACRC9N_07260 [Aeromonas sp.]